MRKQSGISTRSAPFYDFVLVPMCMLLSHIFTVHQLEGRRTKQERWSRSQDCLAIYSGTSEWDDGWCEFEHNFTCELEYVLLKSFFLKGSFLLTVT